MSKQLLGLCQGDPAQGAGKLHKQFPDGPREALAGHVTTLIQRRGTLEC